MSCPGKKANVFFFFQAEDGIRDTSVTGVQTCALPISTSVHFLPVWRPAMVNAAIASSMPMAIEAVTRSEERRVGKESRYQGGPYHEKKRGNICSRVV